MNRNGWTTKATVTKSILEKCKMYIVGLWVGFEITGSLNNVTVIRNYVLGNNLAKT